MYFVKGPDNWLADQLHNDSIKMNLGQCSISICELKDSAEREQENIQLHPETILRASHLFCFSGSGCYILSIFTHRDHGKWQNI
jgi:hypothetical protein